MFCLRASPSSWFPCSVLSPGESYHPHWIVYYYSSMYGPPQLSPILFMHSTNEWIQQVPSSKSFQPPTKPKMSAFTNRASLEIATLHSSASWIFHSNISVSHTKKKKSIVPPSFLFYSVAHYLLALISHTFCFNPTGISVFVYCFSFCPPMTSL